MGEISASDIQRLWEALQKVEQPRYIWVEMSDWAWENWGKYAYAEQEGLRAYLCGILDWGDE